MCKYLMKMCSKSVPECPVKTPILNLKMLFDIAQHLWPARTDCVGDTSSKSFRLVL